ncbi:MAG: crossover junction endodeoxyribonuclease RuvC [Candidatus Berkelbacteria bacterium Licking1014_7]|uniref:Crossover junction endodeoxyribonuclease RuvC n=1 Tax=Candidatus Berkelbacteria bacterium Licking1014_7 TaxID=2017147 RepID=A0A554LIQ7_9BACT|nr:MAG: crossover junction endodeoxyribonuclease RuvC [Candidatus Berkelbacteria bacterium Licking1014_7]
MKILGIDPGTATMGWGIIQVKSQKSKVKSYGVIRTLAKFSDSQRLATIAQELIKIIKKYQPDVAAVEKIFYFKNQKTIITVAQARGVILQVCAQAGLKIFEYTPLQVKQAIACYGRADKEQMQKMVKIHLGLNEIPQPNDAADALAVAICCANSQVRG